MKKYIALFALICILFSSIAVNLVYADTATKEYRVWLNERNKYLAENGYGGGEFYYNYPYMEFCTLTVLLYTDVAKEFVFEKHEYDGKGHGPCLTIAEDWFYGFTPFEENQYETGFWLTSPQISEVVQSCLGEYGAEDLCALRACVQRFGITKAELIEANRKMQEEPESVRELLSFLTDDDFRLVKKENELYCLAPLPDFAIEALYLEDDAAAYRLLSKPYAVYMKEYNRMFTVWELRDFSSPVESFVQCDLTSDAVGDFIAFCEKKYADDICYEAGGTMGKMSDRMAYVKSVREAQLAAAKTGDGAMSALWVIALALSALTVVAVKRKRRI